MNGDRRIRRLRRRDGVVDGISDCSLLADDPKPAPLIVRRWRRLWQKLDAGQVGPLQFAVHFAVGLAGVIGLINSGYTPQDVEDALGGPANAVWLWLCVGGLLSPAGLMLGKGRYCGYWLSLAGDTFIAGVFAVYAFAVIDNRRVALLAAHLSFPFLLLCALTVTTGLIAVDDVRRILAVERTLRAEN